MSLLPTSLEFFAGLPDVSIGFVLIVKWTVVLALAWLAHGVLAGRNPRWRVAIWRSTFVGLAAAAVLSAVPPFITFHLLPRNQPLTAVAPMVPTLPAVEIRGAGDFVPVRDRIETTGPAPSFAPSVVTVGRGNPAPTIPDGFRWGTRFVPWLCTIWLAGVLVLTARLILGNLSLARMIRRSSNVPDGIIRECLRISGRLACRGSVRVRRTSDVATPCLAGVWRPVLLLPECECDNVWPDDLRAILAHELAHARNHDLAWNLTGHVVTILLWFHPLAWRIRSAHAAACDAVCDAVAADLLGDVASYSRSLARLAVRAAWPSPAHGLAMARTSDVRRRLDALNRKVFRTPLSWRCVMPAVFVGCLLLIIIGGFGFTRAERSGDDNKASTKNETEKKEGKLTLRAVSAHTDEPIEGVSISYTAVIDKKYHKTTVTTGEDGTATIEWNPAATVRGLWFTARMPKFVPIYILWDDRGPPLKLPATKELRFEPGTMIGGIVRDEAGHAIEGATVDVHAPPTETDRPNNVFVLGSATTNAEGRWRLDVAPSDLAELWANATHPHFRSNGVPVSRDLDRVVALEKGLSVTGRVVDAAGRPVKGARAIIGRDRFGSPGPPRATTDGRGEFTLENCAAGPSIITVQAEGFAPQVLDVRVEERTAPVEVQLVEPGSIVRGRVVDAQGKPVAEVGVVADTWRGHRSIQFRVETGQDGRFEWRSAPKDAVLYNISKEDYMWTNASLAASDREQTVVLYPTLVIAGRVTDAVTGRPVPKFRVVQGKKLIWRDEIRWSEDEGLEVAGGQYRVQFGDAGAGAFIRVDAPGYKPAVSRAFQPNEGSQTFDFALGRAPGLSGIVVLPDGKPAPGAEVALATDKNGVGFQSGRFSHYMNFSTVATGPDGRFTLPPQDDKFLLIAVSVAGYADALSDEFTRSPKLVLQPWGHIEGGVRIGARFGSDQEVMYQPFRPDGKRRFLVAYNYSTQTDNRGRFGFDWVVPGPGQVSRVVSVPLSGGANRATPCWPEPVYVKPGQTVPVTIGGKGRPVTGRIVVEGTPEAPVDWTLNDPVEIRAGSGWFASKIDKDGRFRIEDVPAGKCLLSFPVNGEPDARWGGAGRVIGKAEMPFTIPDMPGGRSNEPLDLGAITAKLFDALKVGEPAPDFDIARVGTPRKSRRLKLSDYRGKLVLLNFWQAWDGQSDLFLLKEVQAAFGSDPRFVLVSVDCSRDGAGVEKFVKKNGLNWTHAFAGDGVASRYRVREFPNIYITGRDDRRHRVPVTFLIGPDGRIVAHDLMGDDVNAVRKAFENQKLFPAPARTTQPPSSR